MRRRRVVRGLAAGILTVPVLALSWLWIMSLGDLKYSFVHTKHNRVLVGLAKGAIDVEVLNGPGEDRVEVLIRNERQLQAMTKGNYFQAIGLPDDEIDAVTKLDVVRGDGPAWWVRGYYGAVFVPIWILLLPTVAGAALLWRGMLPQRGSDACPKCGYDRRGLAADPKCPECGTVPAPASK